MAVYIIRPFLNRYVLVLQHRRCYKILTITIWNHFSFSFYKV